MLIHTKRRTGAIHLTELGTRVVKLRLALAVPALSVQIGAKETAVFLYLVACCYPLSVLSNANDAFHIIYLILLLLGSLDASEYLKERKNKEQTWKLKRSYP